MTEEEIKRQILIDILLESRDGVLSSYSEFETMDIESLGAVQDTTLELMTVASGIGVIIDDIRFGDITLEEAINEYLDDQERAEFINRYNEILEQNKNL